MHEARHAEMMGESKAEKIVSRLRALPNHALNEGGNRSLTTKDIADEMEALVKEVNELKVGLEPLHSREVCES